MALPPLIPQTLNLASILEILGGSGIQGPPGESGENGEMGPPGKDGITGTNGAVGADGARGSPGDVGEDGQDGLPGVATFSPDFRASGPASMRGLVPDPGASAGTARFLREDAVWSSPTA